MRCSGRKIESQRIYHNMFDYSKASCDFGHLCHDKRRGNHHCSGFFRCYESWMDTCKLMPHIKFIIIYYFLLDSSHSKMFPQLSRLTHPHAFPIAHGRSCSRGVCANSISQVPSSLRPAILLIILVSVYLDSLIHLDLKSSPNVSILPHFILTRRIK